MGRHQGSGSGCWRLEVAVAELQQAGENGPPPRPEPTGMEELAQRLGNARLAAVLVRAGYTSVEAVAAAPDAALLAVDGVGDKALKSIREKVG